MNLKINSDVIIKYATAAAIIYSFLQVVYSINHRSIPEGNRDLFIHLVGIIEGAFVGGLVAYYYTRQNKQQGNKQNE